MLFGAFAAADAGRLGEDGTGAMWVAPELLEVLNAARFPDCAHEVIIQTDLQTNGRVVFAWQPATGELSFAADGIKRAVTLPEDFSAASRDPPPQTCESR